MAFDSVARFRGLPQRGGVLNELFSLERVATVHLSLHMESFVGFFAELSDTKALYVVASVCPECGRIYQ